MLTQGLSTITDRYDYDAWGNEYPIMVSTLDNPYRYVGQLGYYTHWMDSSLTDLLHLGVRFYEPGVGRFSQVDPAGEGWNWYEYVRNAPLSSTDPRGLKNRKWGRVWIEVDSNCKRLSGHLQNVLSKSVKWSDEDDKHAGWNDLGAGKEKVGPIDAVAWQDPVTHKVQAWKTPNFCQAVKVECNPCKKEGEYWFTVKLPICLIYGVTRLAPPKEGWFYPVVPGDPPSAAPSPPPPFIK